MSAAKDIEKIEKVTESYTGTQKAAMAFLLDANGKRAYSISGNAKELAAGVMEILVNLSMTLTEPANREIFLRQMVEAVGVMCKELEAREHG